MLAKLNYKPKIDGKKIDSQIKLKKDIHPYQGYWIYEGLLLKLYPDFVSTLATSLENYLKTAEVIFNPIPGNKIMRPPVILSQFTGLVTPSAKTIDSNILKGCKGKTPNPSMGVTKWSEILTQIGVDLLNIIPVAIATSMNAGVVTAPAGAAAPPSVGILAPVPAILQTPFQATQLKSLLTPVLNKAGLMGIATAIDGKTKAAGASGKKEIQQGADIWQAFMDNFIPYLTLQLETQIKIFLTTPGTNWVVPAGIPGNPIVSGSPTPSGLMPGMVK